MIQWFWLWMQFYTFACLLCRVQSHCHSSRFMPDSSYLIFDNCTSKRGAAVHSLNLIDILHNDYASGETGNLEYCCTPCMWPVNKCLPLVWYLDSISSALVTYTNHTYLFDITESIMWYKLTFTRCRWYHTE